MTKMEFDLQYYKEEIQAIHSLMDELDPHEPENQPEIDRLAQLECDYSFEVNLLERLLKA